MATLNFPDEPDTGDKYTDSNSGFTYEWDGTVWKSSDPSTASNIKEIDDISGDFDGSETDFTLKVAGVNIVPVNAQQLIISVGGVMQNAGDDFTVSSSTLTFTTAPTAGLGFFGTYLGTALSLNTVADGTVSPSSLTTTSNYLMGGLTVDQSAGIVTAYQFKGDGSQLTGVASTDNITTQTNAYFGANVSIGGSLTVQGTETIINVEELNVQDKTVGIASTSTPTATTQDGAGAIIYGQTHINILYDVDKAALGISTGVNVSGFLTATRAQVGTGVTITNTGIDAGIAAGIITAKEYYGDATNMTGAGSTFQPLMSDPLQNAEIASANFGLTNIALTFNHGIEAGNADKEVTLRTGSAAGTIVQSWGVGSSITYSFGQAIVTPSADLINENTYFVVVPEGAFKKIGTATSSSVINTYKFTSADFVRKTWVLGHNDEGQLGQNLQSNIRLSSPTQIGSDTKYEYASVNKFDAAGVNLLKKVTGGGYSLWSVGRFGDGQSGTNQYESDAWRRSSPVQVGTDTTWDAISQGQMFTIAHKSDNSLWVWGFGDDGGLGLNESPGAQRRSSPTQIPGSWSDQIYTGNHSGGAIRTDGTMWMWGPNQNSGILGQNDQTQYSSPKQVGSDATWSKLALGSGAGNYVMAIKTNGTLWTWGVNSGKGQLGLNDRTSRSSPTQVGTKTTWKSVSMTGTSPYGFCLAAQTDNTLWAWGYAYDGRLGLNDGVDRSSPTQVGGAEWDTTNADWSFTVGGATALAIKSADKSLWAWGDNSSGCLGQNNRTPYSSPRQVGGGETWTGVAAGDNTVDDQVVYLFDRGTS